MNNENGGKMKKILYRILILIVFIGCLKTNLWGMSNDAFISSIPSKSIIIIINENLYVLTRDYSFNNTLYLYSSDEEKITSDKIYVFPLSYEVFGDNLKTQNHCRSRKKPELSRMSEVKGFSR